MKGIYKFNYVKSASKGVEFAIQLFYFTSSFACVYIAIAIIGLTLFGKAKKPPTTIVNHKQRAKYY